MEISMGELVIPEDSRIGIWWILQKEVVKFTKLTLDVPSVEAWRDVDMSHFELWDKVRRMKQNLERLDYTDIPRGRVLFSDSRQKFIIYGSRIFFANHVQQKQVASSFNLPFSRVNIVEDNHYNGPLRALD